MLKPDNLCTTFVKLNEMPRNNCVTYTDSSPNSIPDAHVIQSATNREMCDNNEQCLTVRSKRIYISVGILFFINLINYMDRVTIAGVLKDVETFYDIDNSQGGLLQTSFVISYMIMAPVFGYLGDRYTRKYIISAGIMFWSVTTLLGSFIPQHYFGLFLTMRALVGVGEASYSTIAPTIIADMFSSDMRSKMLALFYFAIPVGSGLGYIAGSQMATLFGEWYWALRVTPLLGLISVILAMTVLVEPERGEAEGGGGSHLKNTSIVQDLKDVLKIRSFVGSTLGFTCVTFATGALAFWAPTYMGYAYSIQTKKESSDFVNLIFGVITCVAGIIGVVLGSATAQYYRKYNSRADPLVCAVGVLGSVPLLYLGCIIAEKNIDVAWVLIFFGEVFLCMNWAIVADMLLYVVIPTRRSIAEALQILTSHALGDAASPYLIGAISDAISKGEKTDSIQFYSLQYALYVTTFVLVLGGFGFLMTALYITEDKTKCERTIQENDDKGETNSYFSATDLDETSSLRLVKEKVGPQRRHSTKM